MPNLEDLVYEIGGAHFITTLDLTKGYWQVPMEASSQDKTAFITHRGCFRWKVMPFGLKNASSTFQRLTNMLLEEHKGYACGYIDDIAVYSSTWEEHVCHLRQVLQSIENANLTVNLKKCHFALSKVKYLGHIVGSGCHEPDRGQVQAILDLNPPRTKKELQQFLGMSNYYRMYIKGYSELVKPLTDLTRKSVPCDLPWEDTHQSVFEMLKMKLCSAPVLMVPDYSKPFVLHVDASSYAIGACVSQENSLGEEHPVAYASQKLSETQSKWSTIEKEAYAVVWALKRFDSMLFGARIDVVSDHNPLAYIAECCSKSAKLTRWALALQRYRCTLRHRAGHKHKNADMLSRI